MILGFMSDEKCSHKDVELNLKKSRYISST